MCYNLQSYATRRLKMETKRSTFSGKIGFVLAAAGSAVGLGNIWRFPYLAAKYGGVRALKRASWCW